MEKACFKPFSESVACGEFFSPKLTALAKSHLHVQQGQGLGDPVMPDFAYVASVVGKLAFFIFIFFSFSSSLSWRCGIVENVVLFIFFFGAGEL